MSLLQPATLTQGATLSLLLGALLCLTVPGNRNRAAVGIASQAIATLLTLFAVAPVLGHQPAIVAELDWSYPVDLILLRIDGLGALFLAFSMPLTLLGAIYAHGYLRGYFNSDRNIGVHYALLNLVSLSYLIIYSVENGMVFLLGWEIAALAAWLLVIWEYRDQKVRFAGFNYLVSTHLGLLFLITAFLILSSEAHSFDFSQFGRYLRRPGLTRNVIFLLLVASFGLKSAFFPMHTWLPRAHAAAPAHVSALMSGVIHKAGLYGLLRFTLLMATPDEWMGWFLIAFALLSAVTGVMYTAVQRDLKRLLGYSSTENVGIACLGFGIGYLGLSWHNPVLVVLGFAGGLLHALHHAVFKCLLFYAAGAVYSATHSVDIERLGGLARRMPVTAAAFLLGSIAIAALPPLNGFVSEFLLYSGLFDDSVIGGHNRGLLALAATVLAFVGAVSAFAVTRAFGLTFLGTPRQPLAHEPHDPTFAMQLALYILAALLFVFGLVPQIGLALVAVPAEQFIALVGSGQSVARILAVPLALLQPLVAVSAAVLLLIGLLALLRKWLVPGPVVLHRTWGCGYTEPLPRAQYSAASFSGHLASYYQTLFPQKLDSHLPDGPFPHEAHLRTHTKDAVEDRMFEVLKTGEASLGELADIAPRTPGLSFAIGLVVLLATIALVLASTGGRL
jgi:hydrogenase-4 component B